MMRTVLKQARLSLELVVAVVESYRDKCLWQHHTYW